MADKKSVTVLMPNGRRQNVKVTPNSTIMQVLEEVCQKHGYNPEEFDLKHHNKVLDVSAIFRFSGLPNNAQLEIIPCTKCRTSSNVTICIQVENGNRLTGEYSSNTSLIQILQELCPEESVEKVILIYMHRKIFGEDELTKTTLKSLGLNSGKAMLRLMNRDPEQMKYQAHVYVPPTSKSSNIDKDDDNEEPRKKHAPSWNMPNKVLEPISLLKAEKLKVTSTKDTEGTENNKSVENEYSTINPAQPMEIEKLFSKTENDVAESEKEIMDVPQEEIKEELKIEYLGERNALIFNKADIKALPRDELPDSFFDLTVTDAQKILLDIKRKRAELEDSPLLTASQRQLEEDKAILNRLNKYTQVVIRVQFPDQLVLQALFHPLESVQTIKNFIKKYLVPLDDDFSLHVTPPKRKLDPNKRLVDENLVPSAVLYYSGQSELLPEMKSKLTDPVAANQEATKYRTVRNRGALKSSNLDISEAVEATPEASIQYDHGAGPSGVSQHINKNEKIPKWFKKCLK